MIKIADKGSAVLIRDNTNYVAETERQLSEVRFYKTIEQDPITEFSSQTMSVLKTMHNDFNIDKIHSNI